MLIDWLFLKYNCLFLHVFRGFCRPIHEGGGGKEIHQAEETVGILGSTPLSEPVGLHCSGTGNTALCGVNTLQNKPVSVLLRASECKPRLFQALMRHFCDKASLFLRLTSTGRPCEQMLSTTWTWATWCLTALWLREWDNQQQRMCQSLGIFIQCALQCHDIIMFYFASEGSFSAMFFPLCHSATLTWGSIN